MIGCIVPEESSPMSSNAVAGELLYVQPKRKIAAGFAANVAIAALSFWLGSRGNPFGFPAAVLFGVVALGLLALLALPRRAGLRVGDDGFEMLTLFGSSAAYPWDAVR